MDPLAAPAQTASAHRSGVSFTSIGVEVEEPVFLDEAESPEVGPRDVDRPSPFDLFADEDALPQPAPPPVAAPVRAVPKPASTPAPVKPAAATPDLFKASSSSNPRRVSLIALFVVIATTTMIMTVQACQVTGVPRSASVSPGP